MMTLILLLLVYVLTSTWDAVSRTYLLSVVLTRGLAKVEESCESQGATRDPPKIDHQSETRLRIFDGGGRV